MTDIEYCPDCGAVLVDPAEHSDPARKRFFAIMREAYENLPDHWQPLIMDREHLRKWVLCNVGYCDSTATDCGSSAAAERVAALVKHLDRFAVVTVRGPIVTVNTARSMAKRNCPKAVFLPLAEQCYAYLEKMTGYNVESGEAR